MRGSSVVPFLSGGLLGALAVVLVGHAPADVAPPDPAGGDTPGATRTLPAAAAGRRAVDLQPVLDALAAIERRLDAAPARTPAAAPIAIDEDALLTAFVHVRDREERLRCDGMTDRELFDSAEQLLHAGRTDRPRCRRLLELLLERKLEPSLRAQALLQLGMVLRDLREYEAGKVPLRTAMDEFGIGSAEGAKAGIDLAMMYGGSGDYATGIQLADRVAREGPHDLGFEARWTAAWLARRSGDLVRARADFAALVNECERDPDRRWIAQNSAQQLRELDATPR